MKFLLLITLLLSALYAEESVTKSTTDKITIGLGIYEQTQPYKSLQPKLLPSPVIFFDNGVLYAKWSRVGLYFLGEKKDDFSWGLSLTAEPRTFGFDADETKEFTGLESRKSSIEGGLALSASYHKSYIEVMLLSDILARNDSWLLKTEIGDEFHFGDFTLYSSLILSYYSDRFVNYYYGVSQAEVQRTAFSYFQPKGGFGVGAESYLTYPLTKNLSTMVNLHIETTPESAHASPLLDKSLIYSGLVSLIYTLHY